MRLTMGHQVVGMWHALKEKKGDFIPGFIGSLLQMTLVKPKGASRFDYCSPGIDYCVLEKITVKLQWIQCVDYCV